MPDPESPLEKYRLIACSVFTRELCAIVARTRRVVDPDFLELALHERSDMLREQVQDRIDAAEGKGYAGILLAYGLCGNSLAGVKARSIPLVIPRAHDCCTIFLGSSKAFVAEFGESLSARWSSCGYMERGSDYMRRSETGKASGFGLEYGEMVEKYGEENAAYLWETLHPEPEETDLRYIETASTEALGRAELIRAAAVEQQKEFKLIRGDERLLRGLIEGPWDDRDFLTVPPGAGIKALYDFDRVLDIV